MSKKNIVIINSLKKPEIKIKTEKYTEEINTIVSKVYPILKKYKSNPPQINELLGKNAKWSCGVKGISIKYIREKNDNLKTEASIMRSIVEASITRKHLLLKNKDKQLVYQEIKDVLAELKSLKIYQPKPAVKNQFKGFKYEVISKHGTKIQSINRSSAQKLLILDNDLQPLLKAFNLKLKKLHETQSTVKEGHNRNQGSVISIKVLDRNYIQVFYTALHELAHNKEFNHGEGFKDFFGDLISWCYHNKYPTSILSKEILRAGINDKKYSPKIKM